MTGRGEPYPGLEVLSDSTPVSRSKSPYPEDPVYLHSQSPQTQTTQSSPSQPSEWSYGTSDGAKIEHYPAPPAGEENERKTSRNICGLRPFTFWILVALIFLICAGAIGGGVGGSLAVQSNKSAAESPSPSPQGIVASSSKAASSKSPIRITTTNKITTTEKITQSASTRTSTVTSTLRTTTTQSTSTTTQWVSAANPIPTGNSQTQESRFWLKALNTDADRTTFGYVACDPVCYFWLDSSHLYGWYSNLTQYIDCYNELVINAEEVDQNCILFDAGFSIGTNASLYHGGSEVSAIWWYDTKYDAYYTDPPGYPVTLQVNTSSGPSP